MSRHLVPLQISLLSYMNYLTLVPQCSLVETNFPVYLSDPPTPQSQLDLSKKKKKKPPKIPLTPEHYFKY